MDNLKQISVQLEEKLDSLSQPLKPHLPALARFLLVVTYLEDSFRILFQWNMQVQYFTYYKGYSSFFAYIFLLAITATMIICSSLAVMKKHTNIAVIGLGVNTILQSIFYGFALDWKYLLRNLSLLGGLILLASESYITMDKKNAMFAGLPSINKNGTSTYMTLLGRVLLVLLFLGLAFGGEEMSLVRLIFIAIASVVCVMVVVGFKAKFSAILLIAMLSLFNVFVNNWWSLHHEHPERDFLKYDFFQTLSVMGGLLMLVNIGPGNMSIDEKKKQY
ncbi:Surfeit locus 4 domain-containing protein [Rozella allomycis CSF55]|uniref:Surfeit locus 4 domain-containing protein n=1 Tax=Rozella allomycis (strain CSF55) TaxID=988480 RepID=A0A075AXJ9_ROZAC|nr:Surfeit locus 4 domain-containing protein [Rozella allomycis CSF55]|eukprot:EPZ34874.1 Surfeit locus 4 domain-containing protein [Rozella allomycis CSF55]